MRGRFPAIFIIIYDAQRGMSISTVALVTMGYNLQGKQSAYFDSYFDLIGRTHTSAAEYTVATLFHPSFIHRSHIVRNVLQLKDIFVLL